MHRFFTSCSLVIVLLAAAPANGQDQQRVNPAFSNPEVNPSLPDVLLVGDLQQPANVHSAPAGSKALGEHVAEVSQGVLLQLNRP